MNRHLGLFLITVVTTTVVGADHYSKFHSAFTPGLVLPWWRLAVGGLFFSVPFLGFLTAHEFGHYGMARWHGLRPSLPYYLPAPLPLTGSLGAVIIFRGHFPNRRVLFDFAAGGPIAGFVVALAASAIGLHWSPVVRVQGLEGTLLADPLLFGWLGNLVIGPVRDGYTVSLHPTALAGWLGLLFTMMNLVPISQLDGGHIAYAALRHHSRWVTVAALVGVTWAVIGMGAYTWTLWLVLLLVMMRLIGWQHPPALDDELPLDAGRLVLLALVIAILVLCYMPVPFPDMPAPWS
jgi:membrane-associated protease RseP (regulator of RpoE activity)